MISNEYERGYRAGRRSALREMDEAMKRPSPELDEYFEGMGDIVIITTGRKPIFAFHRQGDKHLIPFGEKSNKELSSYISNFTGGDKSILTDILRDNGWKGKEIYIFSGR